MLEPMRSIAPLVRCDPARLERIRLKEKHNDGKANKDKNKDFERPDNSSSFSISVPFRVELAEGYASTPSVPTMPTTPSSSREPTRNTTSEFRANDGYEAKQRIQRSDFDKHIKQDIDLQASKAAKRRRISDEKPTPPPTRVACKNLRTNDKEHQSQ